MQTLQQLSEKLNVNITQVSSLKQLTEQIPHMPPNSQIWLDAEVLQPPHEHTQLKAMCTTLQLLWDLHHENKLRVHIIIDAHMCVTTLKSLMAQPECGWIVRSDLSVRHICAHIMHMITCHELHVSVSVMKILQNLPVLTAKEKTRISWLAPAHTRILRDSWIKQAYAHMHISYNEFESWESFIRSIVMPTFSVHVIIMQDEFLTHGGAPHAHDLITCVHTLRSHADPQSDCDIHVAVNPQTPVNLLRTWSRVSHVRGITCSFDAQYGYHTWETSLAAILNKQHHVPDPIAQKLHGHKAPAASVHKFTPREQQIWELIVKQGASNKQIAHRLHISEAGVKQHVSRMLKKHTLRSRTQLVHVK